MPNSNAYIRKLVNAKRTRDNKGLEMTIKLVVYDNGIININGNPMTGKGHANRWLSANRCIAQMLEMCEAEAYKQLRA